MTDDVPGNEECVIGVLLHDFQLGGAERVAIRLANAWSRAGCKVIVFTGGGGVQRQLLDESIEVRVADPPIARGSGASPPRLGKWVASHCASARVNALYLPGNSYFRTIGPLSATGVRIYTVITNSLWRIDRSLFRNLIFAAVTRLRLRNVAGVISMSPALLKQARRTLGSGLPHVVLPNALFETLPGSSANLRRRWHVCAVGRLVPQKNFALLLRSFALLADLPVTLGIAGDGPQMPELQKLAASLGLADRVKFLGAVVDAAGCMAEAEVLVLTSDYEGYPAVAMEALAVGTYVIASNCSVGIADILATPELGAIVNGHSPTDFEAALRRFFEASAREESARRLALAHPLLQPHVAYDAALSHLEFMGLLAKVASDGG